MKIIYTADLCDIFISDLQVAKPIGFRNFGMRTNFHGKIVTVKVFEENELIKEILSEDGNGKVLVIDGGGSDRRALMGDNMCRIAIKNGWRGVIVNGVIRDTWEIAKLNFGIQALGTNPHRSEKTKGGQLDVVVQFADIKFTPGHYVYCDDDGIVVSPKEY